MQSVLLIEAVSTGRYYAAKAAVQSETATHRAPQTTDAT